MTPEGKVKKACRAYLDEIGCYRFSPVPTGYGKRTLDDLVCWRGLFIGIEYKRPGGERRAHQINTARDINEAGGVAWCVERLQDLHFAFDRLYMLKTGGYAPR